jgi:hypothetical protein
MLKMKQLELRQIIKEEISKVLNETSKIISDEFGGIDDSKFIRIVWKMSLDELKNLLDETQSDLKWTKNIAPKGKIMGLFTRRDIMMIKSRIKFLNQIISHKEKDPNFLPDFIKD